jgi:ribosomal protein L7/L12
MDIGLVILAILVLIAALNTERQAANLRREVARVDRKVSMILKELNLSYEDSLALSERVKEIARDPNRKIEAIKVYRDETGQGLAESKQAVEEYISTLGK